MPNAQLNISITNGAGALVKLLPDLFPECIGVEDLPFNPGRYSIIVPPHMTSGGDIYIEKSNYVTIRHRLTDFQGNEFDGKDNRPFGIPHYGSWELESEILQLTKPPFPPVPSRQDVLGVKMHFRGGIVVDSPTYGKMPWWPTALSWCDSATRKIAYDEMRAAGDTHALIEVPNGLPLYNEWGQFYSPDRFGPLDWTNNETSLVSSPFSELVDEVIEAGFKYLIAMDERQPNSTRIVQLVMRALSDTQLQYGLTMPGYDGVFYGWPNDQQTIPNWASLARAIKPNCYLGIEHNVGHIPLGNGPGDYNNGLMSGYDCVLGEFGVGGSIHNDATWQVLGRMIRPYNRPSDQPSWDDPNPPFYNVNSSRGPRSYIAFETDDPYYWVRTDVNNPSALSAARLRIDNDTQYFRGMGCQYIG